MAHNLNETNGKVAMFATQPAWHGLGQIVTEAQTSEEAIKLAGLDYIVEKQPIYINTPLGFYQVDKNFATVRTDTQTGLGVVGNKYTVLQNKDAFKFIDDLVGKKEAIFESAGALGKGERIWISCKLPNDMVIGKNDVAEEYFFITNSHDGSRVVEIAFTNVFIVCNNTLTMALNSASKKARVRHTLNVGTNLFDAAYLLGITQRQREEKIMTIEALQKVKITDPELRRFIEMAMTNSREAITEDEYSTRFSNTVDEVMEYALGDPAQLIEERQGNLWGAVNAVNGYYNNVEKYKTPEKKLNSLMWGTAATKTASAFTLATQALSTGDIKSIIGA